MVNEIQDLPKVLTHYQENDSEDTKIQKKAKVRNILR